MGLIRAEEIVTSECSHSLHFDIILILGLLFNPDRRAFFIPAIVYILAIYFLVIIFRFFDIIGGFPAMGMNNDFPSLGIYSFV